MRRQWRFMMLAVLVGAAGCDGVEQEPRETGAAYSGVDAEVAAFISDTFLMRGEHQPDPGTSVEVLDGYLKGVEELHAGRDGDALARFQALVSASPDSRHAHHGLALALASRYEASGDTAQLRAATDAFLTASRLGLRHGRIAYTDRVADGLARLGDARTLEAYFAAVARVDGEHYLAALDHASARARLGDTRAGALFTRAARLAPEGNFEAHGQWAQWLLDQGRPREAVEVLDAALATQEGPRFGLLSLLRGEAALRLGDEARAAEAFRAAQDMAPYLAARVPQAYRDERQLQAAATQTDAIVALAKLLYAEARGEAVGGQRTVGWTVRNRVYKGSRSGCWSFSNSGATLADRYYNIVYQPSQYAVATTYTDTLYQVATHVYNGNSPDPSTGYCPNSSLSGSFCAGWCNSPSQSGFSQTGAIFFYSVSGTCPSTHPSTGSCTVNQGKVCGNGSYDNCFYKDSRY